jgi:hypothetical protein
MMVMFVGTLQVPRDILVSASTGSGKTLAYGIPIVEALLGRIVPRIRALAPISPSQLPLDPVHFNLSNRIWFKITIKFWEQHHP